MTGSVLGLCTILLLHTASGHGWYLLVLMRWLWPSLKYMQETSQTFPLEIKQDVKETSCVALTIYHAYIMPNNGTGL